ncbi:unnamed protein product [Orchesella dallaii]|uniref:Protein argonaute-2 n=1 Tax=Orchesella dallaii TaxID=48710 RepID=A0ABP1RQM3_9HEXA
MERGGRGGGGRGYQGGNGGGYQSGGGRSFQGGNGGGRGFQGGGGGGRGRGPPPKYTDAARCVDPFLKPYTAAQMQIQRQGWKEYTYESKVDATVQKNYSGPGTWAARMINISVNHFPVVSAKSPKNFAVPTLYHYDIKYKIIRKNQDKEDNPEPTVKPKKGKKKASLEEASSSKALVQELEDVSEVTGKNGGVKPLLKRLPSDLTNVILAYLIPKLRKEYKHEAVVTDGCFNLYSTVKLEKVGIPSQHEMTFVDLKKGGHIEEDDDATIKVMIEPSFHKKTGDGHTIDTTALAKYFLANATLKGFDLSADLRCTVEAGCNAVVKSMPNFPYFQVGRATMIPCAGKSEPLGGGIAAWRGIAANITLGWKPYLNVDIANCAFMINKPVLEVLKEIFRSVPSEDFNKWSKNDLEEARNVLKSCKVRYEVDDKTLGGPIRDVYAAGACDAEFVWADNNNKRTSVYDYFKKKYNITLKHKNGPVLRIRNTSLVPAELCIVKKGQSYNRKLDGSQTTNMLRYSKRDPADLHSDIQARVREMQLSQNKTLQAFGMQVSDRMISMEARVLPPPMLRYGNKNGSTQVTNMCPEDGSWEIWSHDFNFYKPALVESWGLLVVGCPYIRGPDDENLKNFCKSLTTNGAKKGVKFMGNPKIIVEGKCRKGGSTKENAEVIQKTMISHFKGVKLLVVIIPVKGDPLYGAIKHAAEVQVGILTQCVAEKNMSMCKDATVQNIILKINSKLGGINHVVVAPTESGNATKFATLLQDCPILILGADVTHAPPGSRKVVDGDDYIMPSYAAVTGSLDRTGMPFMTGIRAQRKANADAAEVINDLQFIVKGMLQEFKRKSGFVPQKIIYFRDGVGEGQFPEVLHIEMLAIRGACTSLKATYEPKITFITVQKRHKTRIFHHTATGKIENAPAGTVVDKEIVHASENDFYLLSHKGMLGTSRPSRYHVLWDDSDFSKDMLQSLANLLTYSYIRCTKSVKMPACTYYAHLAADRAKKLCEGFEINGPRDLSDKHLNKILERHLEFISHYPMHFV